MKQYYCHPCDCLADAGSNHDEHMAKYWAEKAKHREANNLEPYKGHTRNLHLTIEASELALTNIVQTNDDILDLYQETYYIE